MPERLEAGVHQCSTHWCESIRELCRRLGLERLLNRFTNCYSQWLWAVVSVQPMEAGKKADWGGGWRLGNGKYPSQ